MTINEWIKAIKDGKLDNCFRILYNDASGKQRNRYIELFEKFASYFGDGQAALFSAGGRVEIIGNHTDHNGGRVLTASISLDSVCAARPNQSSLVRIYSKGYPALISADLSSLKMVEKEKGTTAALVRGIASRMNELGWKTGGFDAYITSDVLRGSGLSSSASIEVLLCAIFAHLFNGRAIDSVLNAKISQYAEREYFGKPCGLMDQTACAVGGMLTIDFNGEPNINKINKDFAGDVLLAIVDTGGDHADLTDEYASITREMHEVAAFMGKELLCQVDADDFYRSIGALKGFVNDRAILRAMHFFNENIRVDEGAAALNISDYDKFFSCVTDSGDSSWEYLQNCFVAGSTRQPICLALALAKRVLGEKGAYRVHGGGFGGTILAFVPAELTGAFTSVLSGAFGTDAVHYLNIRPLGSVCILPDGNMI